MDALYTLSQRFSDVSVISLANAVRRLMCDLSTFLRILGVQEVTTVIAPSATYRCLIGRDVSSQAHIGVAYLQRLDENVQTMRQTYIGQQL